jgi:hypothetical protein
MIYIRLYNIINYKHSSLYLYICMMNVNWKLKNVYYYNHLFGCDAFMLFSLQYDFIFARFKNIQSITIIGSSTMSINSRAIIIYTIAHNSCRLYLAIHTYKRTHYALTYIYIYIHIYTHIYMYIYIFIYT